MAVRFVVLLFLGGMMGWAGCKSRTSLTRAETVRQTDHSSRSLRDSLVLSGERINIKLLKGSLQRIIFSPPDSFRNQYIEQIQLMDMEEIVRDTFRIQIEQERDLSEQQLYRNEEDREELFRKDPVSFRRWGWGLFLVCIISWIIHYLIRKNQ